jgi:hypothetical protein
MKDARFGNPVGGPSIDDPRFRRKQLCRGQYRSNQRPDRAGGGGHRHHESGADFGALAAGTNQFKVNN